MGMLARMDTRKARRTETPSTAAAMGFCMRSVSGLHKKKSMGIFKGKQLGKEKKEKFRRGK